MNLPSIEAVVTAFSEWHYDQYGESLTIEAIDELEKRIATLQEQIIKACVEVAWEYCVDATRKESWSKAELETKLLDLTPKV